MYTLFHIERLHNFPYVLYLKQSARVQQKGKQFARNVCMVSTAVSIFYFHSPHDTKSLLVAALQNSRAQPI